MAGTGFVVYISQIIESALRHLGKLKRALVYIGKKSMDVLIWHFVLFRIVIAVQLLINGKSLQEVFEYYPTYDCTNGWWIVYMLVGVIGSILWCNLLRKGLMGKVLKRICAV